MIDGVVFSNFDKIASNAWANEALSVLGDRFLAVIANEIRVRVLSSKFRIAQQMHIEFAGLDRI